MNYNDFFESLKDELPPYELTGLEVAMWQVLNNNWDCAHSLVQSINNEMGSWIHGYLHRVEGDLENAAYWYRRANRSYPMCTLRKESEDIIRTITKIL